MRVAIPQQRPHPIKQAIAEPPPAYNFSLNVDSLLKSDFAQHANESKQESAAQVIAASSTLNHFLINIKRSRASTPQNKQRKQR
jgi:hypothetical protein